MNPTTFSMWLRVSKTEIYGYFVTYQRNTTTSVWIPYLSQVTNCSWKEQAIPFKIQPAISCKWRSIHTKGLLVHLLFVQQVSLAQSSLVHIQPQWGGIKEAVGTLASVAGLTFPFPKKEPPGTTYKAKVLAKVRSFLMACFSSQTLTFLRIAENIYQKWDGRFNCLKLS